MLYRILNFYSIFFFFQKSVSKGRGKRKPKSRAEIIENDISSGSEDLHSKEETNDSFSLDTSRFKKTFPDSSDVKKESKESDISDLELDDDVDEKKKGKAKNKPRVKKDKDKKDKQDKENNEKPDGIKRDDGKKKKRDKKVCA